MNRLVPSVMLKKEMKMYKVLVSIFVFLLAGCSNKAVYDNIQRINRNDCNKVPPSQYEECIDRASKSYEEYKRERERAIGK
jgi:PBP1b-binding outer membrane lipoprotein LpoB